MIVDDYAKFMQGHFGQRSKQLVPVEQTERILSAPPHLSGDPQFRAQVESYGPAGYGAAWGDGSKFDKGISATGTGNVYDHPVLLQNARTAYGESLQARGLVRRYADTIIDKGLRYLPQPKADILGITMERAELWADDVAERFDCWFGDKRCTRDEVNNGYQLQRFVEVMNRRDGEYFLRLTYSSRKDLLNPLQISVVDPTQILGYGLTDTYGYNQSRYDGIERDPGGREIAYHVMVLESTGYVTKRIPAVGPRSGRRFMLHGYQPEYPGQGRGISELAHAIQDYSNITDFSQAQILKAISQSQYNFKTVPSKTAHASNPMMENAGVYQDEYRSPAVDPVTGELPHLFYSRLAEVTSSDPGSTAIFGLKAGEDFEAIKNTAPVEQFASFVEAFTMYLSASSSMPIEVQTMKFGRSYTASMGALILFWRVAEIGRAEQASDWLNPVVEAWLSEEIAAGRVSAPGWRDPLLRAAWLNAQWGGAPMPIIDPDKQSRADKNNIELAAHHLDDVARNHNGSDGKLNRAKLKRQLEELAVPPWSNGSAAGSETAMGNDDESDTETEGDSD